MEARKDSLSTIKLCRFCLAQGDSLTSIYEKRSTKNTVNLSLKIFSCISVEVFPSDRRPTYICNRCKFFMEISYDFKNFCRQADEHILQFIQNATPMTPMTWPQSLLKFFRLANKAPEAPVMKAVIEGGTTVQVTQESDSDEEDDENVYNVKIGDGSDDGSKSARIKVITGADKEKAKPKRGKGFASAPKLARHVRTHNDDRSFHCKYCNKTFVKSHHLTRHLRLKHRETIRTCRGPFGESDQYRCEQCEDSFATQDELIYHSAIHATQNLICPLCQEKFEDVDAVTAHIKSHVNGTEFMCDLCELVFTSKEKLDCHIGIAHDEELRGSVPNLLDESSTEMDVDEDEEDSAINVKELDDHMVVEIKKTSDYLIPNAQEESSEKLENTNSEESDCEPAPALPDLATALAYASKSTGKEPAAPISIATVGGATITKTVSTPPKKDEKSENQTASILRKAEEVKKKVIPQVAAEAIAEKKSNIKAENNSAGTSDKSLRMLEKDLQELKRTHPRNDAAKTPAKPVETLRSRRAQIHTSTPKPRTPTDDRKIQVMSRSPIPEKKLPERRILTKENKEPKESKDAKANNGNAKEDKIAKEKEAKEKEAKEKEAKEKEAKEKEAKEREAKEKEVKQKEVKEKETPKSVVKNGSDKSHSEEGIRRSTRPSKIKDYAKMIRDRSQDSDEENDDSDDTDDDEYKEVEKPVETKARARRASVKTPAPKVTPTPKSTPSPSTPAPRKRGRPRKDAVPPKVRKEEVEDEEMDDDSESEKEKPKTPAPAEKQKENKSTSEPAPEVNKSATEQKPQNTLVSPTGQTLKKIPIKALPPGVKPMPLPVNARTMGGELCEMQIGKKVVKVQKIVMTKAEVEAMAKKGLVEMKDGTMVLKQGIKIPTSDTVLKTSLVGEDKESPSNKKIAAPSRCDFGEDV
ncbi:hypothetical protein PYW07_014558 [Mythimna separata]|uniref:Uncharacterized protein n=1 Tax=Mythimna separata TaxID=271217 RepID=A0AAD7Z1I8_MYTSE|nr:hypothetical protein PYW07_014558 [Mythimna separata]